MHNNITTINENTKVHNLYWPKSPDHPHKVLLIAATMVIIL